MSKLRKNYDLEISKDDPFEYAFSARKNSGMILTNFISTISQPFTLAINSEWGTGKTTFLRMWKQHLELPDHGYKVVYFNAWETDYYENPLTTIISEISDQIFPRNAQLIESAAKVAKSAVPILLKGLVGNLISKVIGSDATKDLAETLGEATQEFFEQEISSYSENKKQLVNFKAELTKIKASESPDKPIVIIIDELDRCKPSYSIEVLECIKHLFSIEGYVFVLAIDKKQLSSSIQHEYGEIDTDGYLRRFIDLNYLLPEPSRYEFAEYLLHSFALDEDFSSQSDNDNITEFNDILVFFAEKLSFSLRKIEQIYAEYNSIIRSYKESILYSNFICVLLMLRVCNSDSYIKVINGGSGAPELMNIFTEFNRDLHNLRPDIRLIVNLLPMNKLSVDSEFNSAENKRWHESNELNTRLASITNSASILFHNKNKDKRLIDLLAEWIEFGSAFTYK
jgi:hypothetical protein